MNGILIIDKPAGLTSHDVVARVRRILKTKRVGHTGTLDPFATGVLVIMVGQATRLAQFLDKDEKEYTATAQFGFATDTGDKTGSPLASPTGIATDIADIVAILPQFRGESEQTPPMYSAKKIDGQKLYELARKGVEVERKAIKINVKKLTVSANAEVNIFELDVVCSAGTYIRTLSEDIAKAAGNAAHLVGLRRTRAGKFDLSIAITLDDLSETANPQSRLLPMFEAVNHLSSVTLNAERVAKTKNGLSTRFPTAEFTDGEAIQMLDEKSELVAIGYFNDAEKTVQPKVVLI